jgi:hypothetical protein
MDLDCDCHRQRTEAATRTVYREEEAVREREEAR